jgi:hypothetical protein
MNRVRPALAVRSVLVVVFVLALAAVSVAAGTTKTFSGKTSQGKPISFKVSNGGIANKSLDFKIDDKCPDGHTLTVHANGFPAVPVSRSGAFGGTFYGANDRTQPTVLKGTIKGNKATGSIKDTSKSKRTGKLCHGSATFSIKAK